MSYQANKETEIQKAENELILIQRERALSEQNISLEELFFHGKAVMMGAKFYHECVMLNIPCVLEVSTQFGRVDSIIEIDKKFIIIEFKSLSRELFLTETRKQVTKYQKHNCPVILIQDVKCFSKFLISLFGQKLSNKIYIYTLEKLIIY